MPALHVRDVPEDVVLALRERARQHGHSMQQELRDILADAARDEREPQELEPLQLITVRSGGDSTWSREEIYGDDGR